MEPACGTRNHDHDLPARDEQAGAGGEEPGGCDLVLGVRGIGDVQEGEGQGWPGLSATR